MHLTGGFFSHVVVGPMWPTSVATSYASLCAHRLTFDGLAVCLCVCGQTTLSASSTFFSLYSSSFFRFDVRRDAPSRILAFFELRRVV